MFEWDDAKAAANLAKHGIDFEDAIGIFDGPLVIVRSDREPELRWKAVGVVEGLEVSVVYTFRGSNRRIISARRASKHERTAYHEAHPGGSSPR